MKQFKKIVEKAVAGALEELVENMTDATAQTIVSDTLAELDIEDISNDIADSLKDKILSFQVFPDFLDQQCPTCYRMHGNWFTEHGGQVPQSQLLVNGKRVFIIDDL